MTLVYCVFLAVGLLMVQFPLFVDNQELNSVSAFNSSDLKFLHAVELKFCGIWSQCDTGVTLEDPELKRIYESYKPMLPIEDSGWIDPNCCPSCSCDVPRCLEYGTCCTDKLKPENVYTATYSRYKCESAQLRPQETVIQNGDMVWMIRSCSRDYVSDAHRDGVKAKCENWREFSGLDTAIPVTDKLTNVTYQNRYCMECNGRPIEDAVFWSARLVCSGEEEGLFLQSVLYWEILDAIKATETCNIVYNKPDDATFPVKFCTETMIDSCNVTGRWKLYDPFIDAACHMFTSAYDTHYKNVFCFMCNEVEFPSLCDTSMDQGVYPLFSSLLKYGADDILARPGGIVTSDCATSQIYDRIKNICRDLTCRFPRTLKEGKCVHMVDTLSGVTYLMYMKFTPQRRLGGDNLFLFMKALVDHIDNRLRQVGLGNFVYNYTMLYKVDNTEKSANRNNFTPSSFETPKESPDTQVDYICFRIGIYVNADVSSINTSALDILLSFDGEHIAVKDEPSNTRVVFDFTLEDYTAADDSMDDHVSVSDISDEIPLKVYPTRLTTLYIIPLSEERIPLVIARKLNCPLVEISTDDVDVITRGNHTISAYGQHIDAKYFHEQEMTSDENYRLYLMCADEFRRVVNSSENSIFSAPTNEITLKQILSITLVMLSVLCSVLTLLTYSLFQELRTQPGINNMCLVAYLIIAQCLFQFGAAQADRVPEWACKTIGVLVHFFWLMVIFWMNVCSYHMFRVFTRIRHIQTKQRTKKLRTTLLYTLYCTLCSSLFVVIVITTQQLSSDTDGIGYGVSVCYLSKRDMYAYVLALPIFLVIVVNIILFGIVVLKIARIPTVESNMKSNRNYFAVYAKLASITGITWIFGVLFFFTDFEVFVYIFIIFNAGQGVFIFLSFICTKRVLQMYKTLLKLEKHSVTENRTTSTKESTFSSSQEHV